MQPEPVRLCCPRKRAQVYTALHRACASFSENKKSSFQLQSYKSVRIYHLRERK